MRPGVSVCTLTDSVRLNFGTILERGELRLKIGIGSAGHEWMRDRHGLDPEAPLSPKGGVVLVRGGRCCYPCAFICSMGPLSLRSALSLRQANPVRELARARQPPFFCTADTLAHCLRFPRVAHNARRFRGKFQIASRYPPKREITDVFNPQPILRVPSKAPLQEYFLCADMNNHSGIASLTT